MQGWQTSYLGLRDMPGELSEFVTTVPAATRERWTSALNTPGPDGEHCQS
ncbi:hypothetical protein [Variovorax guangxiensis]|nr:hypothetical protein [Variovorax guangxiensis]MDR6861531.1 hypothetical protein [Variovorax guangxiensis]